MKTILSLGMAIVLAYCSFAQADVRLTSVNPSGQTLTLKNFGDVSLDISTHWLCNWPAYGQISTMSVLSGSTNLLPDESVSVSWTGVAGSDGECGYYLLNSFANSGAMVDYMEWGSGGHFREGVAIAAGVWNLGEFISGVEPFFFDGGAGDYGVSFWNEAQEGVRITLLNPDFGLVELTNFGNLPQDLTTWQLCNFPMYLDIGSATVILGNINLNTGASVLMCWPPATGADGEMGIYNAAAFANSNAMEDYMQWGSAGHFREGVADEAGLWIPGEFVSGGSPFEYIGGLSDVGVGFWTTISAGCTYADALNYNSTASIDDGSCDFGLSCPTDFNGDLIINTTDLLIFLGDFGGTCE